MKAYTINGSNYFKLADISAIIGFNVSFDVNTKTVHILFEPQLYEYSS